MLKLYKRWRVPAEFRQSLGPAALHVLYYDLFFRPKAVSHRPGFLILTEYSEVRAAMKSVRESLPPNES